MGNHHDVRQVVAPLRRRLLCPGSARELVVGLLPVLAMLSIVMMALIGIGLMGGSRP